MTVDFNENVAEFLLSILNGLAQRALLRCTCLRPYFEKKAARATSKFRRVTSIKVSPDGYDFIGALTTYCGAQPVIPPNLYSVNSLFHVHYVNEHNSLSQCNKRQARVQNFFALISINLVPKVV